MEVVESMFELVDGKYLPQDAARGPWSREHLHGGPAAGLLTHAIESQRDDERFLTTRITFDLMRPVPVAPLTLETRTVRAGRRTRYIDALIKSEDETVARACAVMLVRTESTAQSVTTVETAPFPHWSELPSSPWMVRDHEPGSFVSQVESRMASEPFAGKPMTVWLRVPYDLLPGHPLTPLERMGTMVDFASGAGMMSRPGDLEPFINADCNFYLFREPLGEWLCFHCVGRGNSDGLAVANVNLYDEQGYFGHAAVCALRNPMPA